MTEERDRTQQYFEETREQLASVEGYLLDLEGTAEIDLSIVNEIFRNIHTIKGGADFLGLSQIKELAHVTEDVLDAVRSGEIELAEAGITTLLVVCDSLKEMLDDQDNEAGRDISPLVDEVRMIHHMVREPSSPVYSDSKTETVSLGVPGQPEMFSLTQSQIASYRQDGFNLFILALEYDPKAESDTDIEDTLKGIIEIGYILDSHVQESSDVEGGADKDTTSSTIYVLCRTVLTRTSTLRYLDINPKCLTEMADSGQSGIATEEDKKEIPDEQDAVNSDRRIERRYDRRRGTDDRRAGEAGDRRGSGKGYAEEDIASETGSLSTFTETGTEKKLSARSVRVNVEILDKLMNLVGELVLTRNQLNQNVDHSTDAGISLTAQRLDIVTSELQGSVMATRMQPLGNILSKFHRIIRDMSNHLGKSVNLVLEGEDVELDKSIIENISDPLTHLVRNAIDHGIETPEVRHRNNKPVNATLAIKASQEAGRVVIEIIDDGRGIDREKVKARAIEMGLLDESKANELSEKELTKLIFSPGFSTADTVSDISGRGVGLDVVFTNISKMGGAIDVDTSKGVGTTFKVSLPLTLAIVPSLLVSCNADTYAIPQINLVELVRVSADQVDEKIKFLGDATVLRLRDKLLPIVWLADVIGLSKSDDWKEHTSYIAVVYSGEFSYGIVVDQFTDSEEIVVKPLGKHLMNCRAYGSATILGDGSAALILDVNGIAEQVSIPSQSDMEVETGGLAEEEVMKKAMEAVGRENSMLVVENGGGECFGIELAYVNRIERIRRDSIENMLGRHVVKYRGGVLRVFMINESAEPVIAGHEDEKVYLIVFYLMGNEVALMVSDIVDIVETDSEVEATAIHGAGIVGTSIILDRITMIVDLFELVGSLDPEMVAQGKNEAKLIKNDHDKHTVLVVEDSMFFQDKLRSLLDEMNINVLIAGDGKLGYDMLEQHADDIDLILMDVEMPNMSGIELSKLIRKNPEYAALPIIMLTSLAKQSDIERGMRAGASEYLIKMDQEMVRSTVYKHLEKHPRPMMTE